MREALITAPILCPEDLAIADELCAPAIINGPVDEPAFAKRFAFEQAYGELSRLAGESPDRALDILFHVAKRCGPIKWLRELIAAEVAPALLRQPSAQLMQCLAHYTALDASFGTFIGAAPPI